jgi:hypothetical protein
MKKSLKILIWFGVAAMNLTIVGGWILSYRGFANITFHSCGTWFIARDHGYIWATRFANSADWPVTVDGQDNSNFNAYMKRYNSIWDDATLGAFAPTPTPTPEPPPTQHS